MILTNKDEEEIIFIYGIKLEDNLEIESDGYFNIYVNETIKLTNWCCIIEKSKYTDVKLTFFNEDETEVIPENLEAFKDRLESLYDVFINGITEMYRNYLNDKRRL